MSRVRSKWLLLLLASVVAAVLVGGCGGGDDNDGAAGDKAAEATGASGGELAKFGLQEGKPYDGTELQILICCLAATQFTALQEKSNAEFTKMTGIKVKWGDVAYDTFLEKIIAESRTGGGAYDLVAWVDAWGPAIRDALVPLDDKLEEAGRDLADYPEVFQTVVKAGDPEGKVYGLPLRGHAFLLFYRQDVFDKLGLEPPKTWQELIETGKKIQAETKLNAIANYYGLFGGQNLFNWFAHLWSNGADLLDEENRPAFNSPAGVEATELYIDYLREHKLTPPASVTWGEQEANTAAAQGKAAMFIGWWWMIDVFKGEEAAKVVRDNIAFAPVPGWEGKEAASYGYLWPMGILNQSKNQDAAWEYLKWLSHPEVEKEVALADPPAPQTNITVRLSNLRDPAVNEKWNGINETAAGILEDARTTPMIAEWGEIQSILEVAINEMAGGDDVKSTLDKAAADVEKILERAGYND